LKQNWPSLTRSSQNTAAEDRAAYQAMVALLNAECKRRRKAEKWARIGWALDVLLAVAAAGMVIGILKGRW